MSAELPVGGIILLIVVGAMGARSISAARKVPPEQRLGYDLVGGSLGVFVSVLVDAIF